MYATVRDDKLSCVYPDMKTCEIRLTTDSQGRNATLRYLDMLQKFWAQSRVVSQSSALGGLYGHQFVECLEVEYT